ncbi:MAG: hypothetical protein JWN14_3881 [Chthonomonadales bacterium]|nr:hypothetical protein [Chthonomonadales bacterium]
MGNKKFGLTTYVIVGISLVALYFVGKTVTPPPAAPPVEVKPITAKSPEAPSQPKKEFEERKAAEQAKSRAQQIKEMSAHTKATPASNVATFNPNGIDTESTTYWQNKSIKEGAVGVKEMAAKVAAAKAKMPPPEPPHMQKSAPVDTSH